MKVQIDKPKYKKGNTFTGISSETGTLLSVVVLTDAELITTKLTVDRGIREVSFHWEYMYALVVVNGGFSSIVTAPEEELQNLIMEVINAEQ